MSDAICGAGIPDITVLIRATVSRRLQRVVARMQPKTVTAGVLDVAYLEFGAPDGWPCIMGHGFPYDFHA